MTQKPKYIDLHTHTEYSDGLYVRPNQIVSIAAINGIDVLAITDHDHIQGYFDAKDESEKFGITLIPGTEITTPNYHVLGLNFNPYDYNLNKFLEYSREIQRERCEKRINRLREHGYPITIDEVLEEFPNSRIAQYNLFSSMLKNPDCRVLMEKEFPDIPPSERFKKYFGKDGVIGSVGDMGVSELEAIQAVHNAGGIIGIAHSPKDIKDPNELDALVQKGIDFLEIQPNGINGSYKAIDYEFVKKYAQSNNLALSFGSDYHGPTFERKFLGRGDNILSKELFALLNNGYVKINQLEEVVC